MRPRYRFSPWASSAVSLVWLLENAAAAPAGTPRLVKRSRATFWGKS